MMTELNLQKTTDTILLTQFSKAVFKEKQALAEVILHLAEIDRRRLYAREGYSSLYAYLIEKYHYSEGGAWRRIQAARLSLKYPKVISYLESGKLNLMAVALISPHLSRDNEDGLLKTIMGKSKREVEFLITERFGTKQETVKDEIRRLPVLKPQEIAATGEGKNLGSFAIHDPISNNPKEPAGSSTISPDPLGLCEEQHERRVKIVFSANESFAKKVERAKEILRHKYPKARLEEIFDEALEALLEKKAPERKMARLEKRKAGQTAKAETLKKCHPEGEARRNSKRCFETSSLNMTARYVPHEIRRAVWNRDKGECSYQSPDGKRCGERAFVETDHVRPFALGGKSTAENLQLLCRTHNQYRAQQTFGMFRC